MLPMSSIRFWVKIKVHNIITVTKKSSRAAKCCDISAVRVNIWILLMWNVNVKVVLVFPDGLHLLCVVAHVALKPDALWSTLQHQVRGRRTWRQQTHTERHSQRKWRWRCFLNCCMCVQWVNTTYFYLTLQTAFLPLSFADFFSDSDLKSPWGCPSLSFYLKVESTFILGEGRQSRPSG